MKFKVYVPIASGFEVEVEAPDEDATIDIVVEGHFYCPDEGEQVLRNQQANGCPEIMGE